MHKLREAHVCKLIAPNRKNDFNVFYIASKILWFFLTPSNLIFAAIAIGTILVLWSNKFQKSGRRILGLGTFMLLICGLGPVGAALTIPLEKRFPLLVNDQTPQPTGIIILGGAVRSRSAMASPDMLELNEAGERITALIYLAKLYPNAKIVFSGGIGDILDFGIPEADEVKNTISRLGVDPERILYERKSRNTHENAVFSKDLAQPKQGERWLLVTSAWHMPRSMGCFRQAGFDVEAYAVDFRSNGWQDLLHSSGSVGAGLRTTDVAWREWLGLIAYRLTNKTSALLPE
jgi:uncharacterized SAM-binding protein YcdF (DUF218 family)